MLSNMAANGNNCHEAQSMPTNSDEIYIKNTSAAEYHISKRESYHVAKVNIFQTSIRYACVFTGVFFIGNTTKIMKQPNLSAGSRNPADPPVPHLESGKSARNKKIAFSRGYPRVPHRNEHAACRLDIPGVRPLRGRFRRGVLLRSAH